MAAEQKVDASLKEAAGSVEEAVAAIRTNITKEEAVDPLEEEAAVTLVVEEEAEITEDELQEAEESMAAITMVQEISTTTVEEAKAMLNKVGRNLSSIMRVGHHISRVALGTMVNDQLLLPLITIKRAGEGRRPTQCREATTLKL